MLTGDERDSAIASEVYGWIPVLIAPDAEGVSPGVEILVPPTGLPRDVSLPRKGVVTKGYLVPPFSTVLDIACQVAKDVGFDGVYKVTQLADLPSLTQQVAQDSLDYFRQSQKEGE